MFQCKMLQTLQRNKANLERPTLRQQYGLSKTVNTHCCAVYGCDNEKPNIPSNECSVRYELKEQLKWYKLRNVLLCQFHGKSLPAQLGHPSLPKSVNHRARAQVFQCSLCDKDTVFSNIGCETHGVANQSLLYPCCVDSSSFVTFFSDMCNENDLRVDLPFVCCSDCVNKTKQGELTRLLGGITQNNRPKNYPKNS